MRYDIFALINKLIISKAIVWTMARQIFLGEKLLENR